MEARTYWIGFDEWPGPQHEMSINYGIYWHSFHRKWGAFWAKLSLRGEQKIYFD